MTPAVRRRAALVMLGLAAAFAVAILALRAGSPPATTDAAAAPAPCSSCDARHSRLQDARTDLLEMQK